MTSSHIRIGFCLLLAQIVLLALTMGFHGMMDRSAERAGLNAIIQEAAK